MSFIVKGFDIPKDAAYFKLSFYDGNREMNMGVNGSLKPYIIRIPAGHGDIKDIDELRKGLEADTREAFTRHDVWLILSKYNTNVPTILEAEENK